MQNTHVALVLVLLGGVLLLIPVLIVVLLVIPTLHRNKSDRRGLGDLTQWEARALLLVVLLAATRAGYWLLGLFIAGSLLFAFGLAELVHLSPPIHVSLSAILLAPGIALLAGTVFLWVVILVWGALQWQTRPTSGPITPAIAPPHVRFNMPYTLGTVTITIRGVRNRQAFYRAWRSPQGNHRYVTWFVEFDCLLQNRARREATIWTQLEEIVPETAEQPVPWSWYQCPPLSDDESSDRNYRAPGPSRYSVSTLEVRDRVETKLFFQFDDSQPLHSAAFILHVERKNKFSREARLFTVDLEQPLESEISTGDSQARG